MNVPFHYVNIALFVSAIADYLINGCHNVLCAVFVGRGQSVLFYFYPCGLSRYLRFRDFSQDHQQTVKLKIFAELIIYGKINTKNSSFGDPLVFQRRNAVLLFLKRHIKS